MGVEGAQVTNGFDQVGFALTVWTHDEVDAGLKFELSRLVIAKRGEG